MASKTLLALSAAILSVLLLLDIQFQVDGFRILSQQPRQLQGVKANGNAVMKVNYLPAAHHSLQEAGIPRMKGMTNVQDVDESDGNAKPDFSSIFKGLGQKDGNTKSTDWGQALAALGLLLSDAYKSKNGCGSETPDTQATLEPQTVTANTHITKHK